MKKSYARLRSHYRRSRVNKRLIATCGRRWRVGVVKTPPAAGVKSAAEYSRSPINSLIREVISQAIAPKIEPPNSFLRRHAWRHRMAAFTERPSAKSTAYRWLAAWRDGGVFEALNHAPLIGRERSGQAASLTACIIDSHSVNTNEVGWPRGYDGEKKIVGRKRYALVDTNGRGLVLFSYLASVQYRDGAGLLLAASRRPFPLIEKGHRGRRLPRSARCDRYSHRCRDCPSQARSDRPRRSAKAMRRRALFRLGQSKQTALKDAGATIALGRPFPTQPPPWS